MMLRTQARNAAGVSCIIDQSWMPEFASKFLARLAKTPAGIKSTLGRRARWCVVTYLPGAIGIRMPPAEFAFDCRLDVPESHGYLFTENCHSVTPRAARGAR